MYLVLFSIRGLCLSQEIFMKRKTCHRRHANRPHIDLQSNATATTSNSLLTSMNLKWQRSHQNLTVATSITTNHHERLPRLTQGVKISEARRIHYTPWGKTLGTPPQCDKTSMRSSVILSPSPGCLGNDGKSIENP